MSEANNKVFVCNLPFNATEVEIRELLKGFNCAVDSVTAPTDRDSGLLKGYAFVTCASALDAADLIKLVHKFSYGGRELVAREARPR